MISYASWEDKHLIEEIERSSDATELVAIKRAGILHGNHVVVLRASSRMRKDATQEELEETLRHAVGKYGWSFDDPSITVNGISIGGLYQMLHGKNFLDHYGAAYVTWPREKKDYYNQAFWETTHEHMGTLN